MLTLSKSGRPEIICGKCHEPVGVDSAIVLKHNDISAVSFVCIDCAEILKETYPNSTLLLARVYFEALTANGRARRIAETGS